MLAAESWLRHVASRRMAKNFVLFTVAISVVLLLAQLAHSVHSKPRKVVFERVVAPERCVGRVIRVADYDGVYHLPPPSANGTAVAPRGVMLALHGCSHSAGDWSEQNDTLCPHCAPLPEEMRIVRAALARGYAVLALSSRNRKSKCWSSATEAPGVVAATLEFIKSILPGSQPTSVPVAAIGVSSGGALVAQLPLHCDLGRKLNDAKDIHSRRLNLVAISTQVAHLSMDAVRQLGSQHPAAVAVYMSSPPLRKAETLALVKDHGVVAVAIQAKKLQITPRFFSRRIPTYSVRLSHAVYSAFEHFRLLDKDQYLIEDPRRSKWRDTIREHVPELAQLDSLIADQSALSEELNVAFAVHEITADHIDQTLDVFDNALRRHARLL